MFTLTLFTGWMILTLGLAWVAFFKYAGQFTRGQRRTRGLQLLALTLLVAAGVPAAARLLEARNSALWASRLGELNVTARQAQPVIAGIQAYTQATGQPPRSVDELVPRFLPALPDPGPASQHGWEYWRDGPRPWGARGQPWVLGIRVRKDFCPRCPLGFGDYFVYHPGGVYPRSGYGGILEPVGRWGYYHE